MVIKRRASLQAGGRKPQLSCGIFLGVGIHGVDQEKPEQSYHDADDGAQSQAVQRLKLPWNLWQQRKHVLLLQPMPVVAVQVAKLAQSNAELLYLRWIRSHAENVCDANTPHRRAFPRAKLLVTSSQWKAGGRRSHLNGMTCRRILRPPHHRETLGTQWISAFTPFRSQCAGNHCCLQASCNFDVQAAWMPRSIRMRVLDCARHHFFQKKLLENQMFLRQTDFPL